LFNDLQFNLAQKKDFLKSRYGVRFTDELSRRQASELIGDLKTRKDRNIVEPDDFSDGDDSVTDLNHQT